MLLVNSLAMIYLSLDYVNLLFANRHRLYLQQRQGTDRQVGAYESEGFYFFLKSLKQDFQTTSMPNEASICLLKKALESH